MHCFVHHENSPNLWLVVWSYFLWFLSFCSFSEQSIGNYLEQNTILTSILFLYEFQNDFLPPVLSILIHNRQNMILLHIVILKCVIQIDFRNAFRISQKNRNISNLLFYYQDCSFILLFICVFVLLTFVARRPTRTAIQRIIHSNQSTNQVSKQATPTPLFHQSQSDVWVWIFKISHIHTCILPITLRCVSMNIWFWVVLKANIMFDRNYT